MKIIRFEDIAQVAVSHEDPNDPGVLKKVLIAASDGIQGKIQMINWATLLPQRSLGIHKHQDMQEIFIMLASGIVAEVNEKEFLLNRGDVLVVDHKENHVLKNPSDSSVEYIVIGVA